MQRYLITGASGFVARHFLNLLESRNDTCEVLGLDISQALLGEYHFPVAIEALDMLDSEAVEKCVLSFEPTRILHLASVSSVAVSWSNPVDSFTNNTNIFLNLIEPIRKNKLAVRVLSVGSSEEYGIVEESELPLLENRSLSPGSPYAVARVAQEQLSRVFARGYDLDIVMTRSFNHLGPGQRDQFVVSSFVKQAVEAKLAGARVCELRAGDTSVVRDFLDVRDVVRAYYRLFDGGRSGEVYNVCSGIGRSLNQVLDELEDVVGIKVNLDTDSALFRRNELMKVIGSSEKLSLELGWTPEIDFRTSLSDMADHWERTLSQQENPKRG